MGHCGNELNEYIPDLDWCEEWNIKSGKDYLTAWVAAIVQDPYCKLPYLFMYGPQNSGKSSFHEALGFLFTQGVTKADRALTSKSGYNGELDGAILAVVDEVDVAKSGSEAYNRLKEWVTADKISIHAKYKQVEDVLSTLHFVQMANFRAALPVFSGDTRITAMYVGCLEEEIPRGEFHRRLREEAPHFMRTLMDFELHSPIGRLHLPLIETQGKLDAAANNDTPLQQFINESCYCIDGARIQLTEFCEKFRTTIDEDQHPEWGDRRIRTDLRELFPIARASGGRGSAIGNLTFNPNEKPSTPYIVEGKNLVKKDH
jgi:hypothetical protein